VQGLIGAVSWHLLISVRAFKRGARCTYKVFPVSMESKNAGCKEDNEKEKETKPLI